MLVLTACNEKEPEIVAETPKQAAERMCRAELKKIRAPLEAEGKIVLLSHLSYHARTLPICEGTTITKITPSAPPVISPGLKEHLENQKK